MKKIGIVGGVAWPSTVEYYRLLCAWTNEHFRKLGSDLPYPTPPMTIESVVMHETRKLRAKPTDGDDAWAAYDAAFRNALLRLQHAGCDFGIIANNTSHTRLHSIRKGLDMPIISILEEAAKTTRSTGARNAVVLGTSVTMRSDDYASALMANDVRPNDRLPEDVINFVQSLIDVEFEQKGTVRGRNELLKLCESHVGNSSDTAVLLACTELPLAFPEHAEKSIFESDGFTFVNTTAVHVRAALAKSLGSAI